MSKEKQSYETSALKNIFNAGEEGVASPSFVVQISASITPPGVESAVAQGIQAGLNMAVAGSKEFMTGTIRQYGPCPSAVLQNLKIRQSIANKTPVTPSNQPANNKGIEAARQKAAAKTSETTTDKSTNKGIKSYQSKVSGQSTSNSNNSANSTVKESGSDSGKSSGNSHGR